VIRGQEEQVFESTHRFGVSICLVLASLLGSTQSVAAQTAPDNTKVNERDRQPPSTVDQQMNNQSDIGITGQIRKAIVDDKSLSTYAHNVKVITQKGKVTLKGPVRTPEEKTNIEAGAARVAGASNVVSQLAVAKTAPRK
jgi:osmotically-inducible protein OsmY